MAPSASISRFSLVERHADRDFESFAVAVEQGLGPPRKSIPCRFLYDDPGSQLFEEICDLPEYYVTRAEREILAKRAHEIAERFGSSITLAELGSGSSTKTRLLIEAFLSHHGRLRYVPVDISRAILEESSLTLLEHYDGLEIRAIASEYQEGLRYVRSQKDRTHLIAWLGSNVGNLTREEAAEFLLGVRHVMAAPDRLLIGIDLRKDKQVLERAYDDSKGVTARFSLNLLARVNRELGGDFDLQAFSHRAVYDEDGGQVDVHLVSRRAQRVRIDQLDRVVDFAAGEPIHIESAFKYSFAEIDELAAAGGMRVEHHWLDDDGRFSLNLFAPV